MTRVLRLAAASIACCAVAAAYAEPLQQLEECIARVSPQEESLAAIRAVCPDVDSTLAALGYAELLCSGCDRRFGLRSLEDLRALATRYGRERQTRSPDTTVLRPILDELAHERVRKPQSWWDIIRTWILERFKGHEPESFGWLKRLLAGSGDFFRITLYLLLGVVLIAAVYVVIREFRAVRPFSRQRTSSAPAATRQARVTPYELSMRDVDAATPLDRPALLLKLLVTKLLECGRLPRERDLTHRELALQAKFDTQAQREQFRRLAQSAEALLYGSHGISTELEETVAEGRALWEGIAPRGNGRK